MGQKVTFNNLKFGERNFRFFFTSSTFDPNHSGTNGDAVSTPKHVKNEVSGVRNGKFEFNTIKNHYIDIYDAILYKRQKKPPNGVFKPLNRPRGRKLECVMVSRTNFILITIAFTFWLNFRKI